MASKHVDHNDPGLYIAYASLLSAALLSIYTASFASLRTPATTRELRRKLREEGRLDDEDDEEDESARDVSESLTSADAWLFPVFGSAALLSIYLVFRYIDPALVNKLLAGYFALVGVMALAKVSITTVRSTVGRALWYSQGKYELRLSKEQADLFHLIITPFHLPLIALSAVLVTLYLYTRHWIISNILALSLSYNAIALISLDSFVTGSILLGGLFVYDITWVFGTDVMVSVARNLDAPIKIVAPKNSLALLQALVSRTTLPKPELTLLGLGDIVVPGVFVALALRFDQYNFSVSQPSASFTKSNRAFPKPYFHATLLAYFLGLATTMGVMHIFKAAQPALLYLSPACVGAVAIRSIVDGRWKEVWGWSDVEEEEEEEEEKVVDDGDAEKERVRKEEEEEVEDDEVLESESKVVNGSSVGSSKSARRRKGKGVAAH